MWRRWAHYDPTRPVRPVAGGHLVPRRLQPPPARPPRGPAGLRRPRGSAARSRAEHRQRQRPHAGAPGAGVAAREAPDADRLARRRRHQRARDRRDPGRSHSHRAHPPAGGPQGVRQGAEAAAGRVRHARAPGAAAAAGCGRSSAGGAAGREAHATTGHRSGGRSQARPGSLPRGGAAARLRPGRRGRRGLRASPWPRLGPSGAWKGWLPVAGASLAGAGLLAVLALGRPRASAASAAAVAVTASDRATAQPGTSAQRPLAERPRQPVFTSLPMTWPRLSPAGTPGGESGSLSARPGGLLAVRRRLRQPHRPRPQRQRQRLPAAPAGPERRLDRRPHGWRRQPAGHGLAGVPQGRGAVPPVARDHHRPLGPPRGHRRPRAGAGQPPVRHRRPGHLPLRLQGRPAVDAQPHQGRSRPMPTPPAHVASGSTPPSPSTPPAPPASSSTAKR